MKIAETYTYNFPTYALSALINGDYSGLEDNDRENLEAFLERESYIDHWATMRDKSALQTFAWFERDRKHLELLDTSSDETILEFWDSEVNEIIEDGFITPPKLYMNINDGKNWHDEMMDYADYLGLLGSYACPDPHFCRSPEFGLACDCVAVIGVVWEKS